MKSGSRPQQIANYRDHTGKAPASRQSTGHASRGTHWGQKGVMPHDLRVLAKAASRAGRGFTYAKVTKSGLYKVPIF